MIKLSKIFLTQKTKHMGKSMNSPTRLKLPVFRGEKNWDSFTFQFERQVRHYNGRSEWRALINCLHDKALDFALELIQFKMQLCQSFEEDVKAIQNMRGTYFCQTPITVCSTKKGVKFWVFTESTFLANGWTSRSQWQHCQSNGSRYLSKRMQRQKSYCNTLS